VAGGPGARPRPGAARPARDDRRPAAAGQRGPDRRGGREPSAGARRSLQLALLVLVAGVLLAVIGAGRAWAVLQTTVAVPLGHGRVGGTALHGNDFAPFSGLALLALVLVVGIAVTRGRGRWVVGLTLLALGAALLVQAIGVAGGARAEAETRVRRGEVVGVVPGQSLRVDTPRAGPALVAAGGLLLALAGVEALRRGPRWPALGAAFRAPPDRQPPPPTAEDDEPPWEGD
jgi:Tryptophan-associated transmembrane protein (Trp_oprn_chp)